MERRNFLGGLGVCLYAGGSLALGLAGLIGHNFSTAWQPVPDGLPYRVALAYLTGGLLLLGALAMLLGRWAGVGVARAGAVLLGLLYLVFAKLWLPRVVGYPQMIGTWLGFCEELALALGAGVVLAASLGNRMAVRVGQVLFGLCVISFGLAHLMAVKETAAMVPKWFPPGQHFWAVATGVAHLLAGAAIAVGVQRVLAARLLAVMLVVFEVVWVPMLMAQPHLQIMWAGNALTVAMAGAAWIMGDKQV